MRLWDCFACLDDLHVQIFDRWRINRADKDNIIAHWISSYVTVKYTPIAATAAPLLFATDLHAMSFDVASFLEKEGATALWHPEYYDEMAAIFSVSNSASETE